MPEELKYKIKGKIVNSQFSPIPEANIQDDFGNKTTSQPTGNFTLKGSYPSGSIFDLSVTAKDYGQVTITPFNQDQSVKSNINPTVLKSNKANLSDSISSELPLSQAQVKSLKLSKTNFEMAQQQALNKVITTAKTVLLPAVLTQLAAFGISKASEAVKMNFKDVYITCPPNLGELNKLIAKKNRLVKQLNNLYNFLNGVKVGVEILDGILTVAEIVIGIAKILTFIPITPFTPLPTKTASVVEKIEREIKKYKLLSSVTLMILIILIQILETILSYLALLDQAIGKCAQELSNNNATSKGITTAASRDITLTAQTSISTNLLLSTQFQSNQLSPVVTNANGFEMSVITVEGDTNEELQRRRAIARNTQGIIMLQGEPSYSSNDQILIDELVYYIKQNDLKA